MKTSVVAICVTLPGILSFEHPCSAQVEASTPALYHDYGPVWSPDGERLAFYSNRAGSFDLYVVNADGSELIRITDDPRADDQFPSWSPDGKRLAFQSNRASDGDIFLIRPDGTDLERLTRDGGRGTPAWAPESNRVVYRRRVSGHLQLFWIDVASAATTQVTDAPSDHEVPDFSPDGLRLAYTSRRSGNLDIYVRDLVSGAETRVTTHLAWDSGARWSPDGEWLVFYSDREDDYFDIYVTRPDGTGLRSVSPGPDWDLDVDWAPDGSRLAWHSRFEGRYALNVVDVASGARTILSNREQSEFAKRLSREGKAAVDAVGGLDKAAGLYHPSELRFLADALSAKGEHDAAIELHRLNASIHPDHAIPYYGWRLALLAAGHEAPPRRFDVLARLREDPAAMHDELLTRWSDWRLIDEGIVNSLGYELLNNGRAEDALVIFEINAATFPRSANVYDSRGEALARLGRTQEAIESYGRALELDPTLPSAISQLKKLRRQ